MKRFLPEVRQFMDCCGNAISGGMNTASHERTRRKVDCDADVSTTENSPFAHLSFRSVEHHQTG